MKRGLEEEVKIAAINFPYYCFFEALQEKREIWPGYLEIFLKPSFRFLLNYEGNVEFKH